MEIRVLERQGRSIRQPYIVTSIEQRLAHSICLACCPLTESRATSTLRKLPKKWKCIGEKYRSGRHQRELEQKLARMRREGTTAKTATGT